MAQLVKIPAVNADEDLSSDPLHQFKKVRHNSVCVQQLLGGGAVRIAGSREFTGQST